MQLRKGEFQSNAIDLDKKLDIHGIDGREWGSPRGLFPVWGQGW
jgi:hypothetical protein